MATTKVKPTINLVGDRQAETIQECFRLKEESKTLETQYKEAKEKALPIIFKKILNFWKKNGAPEFGGYILKLSDGTEREVAIQNVSSKKKFTPVEVKNIYETIGCKGGDIFDITTNIEIDSELIGKTKIRNEVVRVLKDLENQLRINGDISPEEQLVKETKHFKIVEHAIPRLMAKESEVKVEIDEALTLLKDPVICLIKE